MSNEEFILSHLEDDVRSLALKKMPEGIDALWVLKQIEGYQTAKRKLPSWAEVKGLWFPPKLSMEQCSSQSTAEYKALLLRRLLQKGSSKNRLSPKDDRPCEKSLVDLTGGFGVDFSYMSREVDKAIYVERQEELCEAARHNFPLLNLANAEVHNEECESFLNALSSDNPAIHFGVSSSDAPATRFGAYFIDPARRDDVGKKVFFIEDCTPDLTVLQNVMLSTADYIIVKLSPMLDITQALRSLKNVREVHVVSVKGECKELLFVMQSILTPNVTESISYHCVNLDTDEDSFVCPDTYNAGVVYIEIPCQGQYLYEPNASIMKAGMQDAFAEKYGLEKLHPHSNLFIGETLKANIPARSFLITDLCDFSKSSIRTMLKDVCQANITIRNFPSTVPGLRKRLKVKEGGAVYLFATTLKDGKHVLIKCEKPKKD